MRLSFSLALLLAACGTEGAPPALLPLDEILDSVPPPGTNPGEELAARGESLRARAAGLRAASP